jgi:hypothetical protein
MITSIVGENTYWFCSKKSWSETDNYYEICLRIIVINEYMLKQLELNMMKKQLSYDKLDPFSLYRETKRIRGFLRVKPLIKTVRGVILDSNVFVRKIAVNKKDIESIRSLKAYYRDNQVYNNTIMIFCY